MFVTLNDVRTTLRGAVEETANRLGVKFEDGRYDLALAAIDQADVVACATLYAYGSGLAAWYQMHRDLEASGSVGRLTAEQATALMKVIDNKEAARKALIDLLNDL